MLPNAAKWQSEAFTACELLRKNQQGVKLSPFTLTTHPGYG